MATPTEMEREHRETWAGFCKLMTAAVIAVAILFRALEAFKIFDQIFMLTQGQPGTSTETISWYIYQVGYKFFNMGYAAAVSYLLLIFLSVVGTIYAALFLREERL